MKKLLVLIVILLGCLLNISISFAAENIKEYPEISIIIDGNKMNYNDVPINFNGRTLLPLREMLVSLGVQNDSDHIKWNSEDRSVTVVKNDKTIYLKINSKEASINESVVTIDAEPIIYNNKTYIPIRFVAETFGKKVLWDSDRKEIVIYNEDDLLAINKILSDVKNKVNSFEKCKITIRFNYTYKFDDYKGDIKSLFYFEVDDDNQILYEEETDLESNTVKKTYFKNGIYYKFKEEENLWKIISRGNDYLDFKEGSISDVHGLDDILNDDFSKLQLQIKNDAETGDTILEGFISPKYYTTNNEEDSGLVSKEDDSTYIKVIIGNAGLYKNIIVNLVNKQLDESSTGLYFDMKFAFETDNFISRDFDNLEEVTPEMLFYDNYSLGYSEYNKGNYEKAIEYFEKAIEYDPSNYYSYLYAANSYTVLNKYEESINLYEKAIETDSSKIMAYVNMGKVLRMVNRYEEAIESYKNAISWEPDNYYLYLMIGNILDDMGKFEEAIQYYDKGIEINSNDISLYSSKGGALLFIGEKDEARKCFEKAVEIKNYSVNSSNNRGLALMKLERYEEALIEFDKFIELVPYNPTGYNNKAATYLYMGKYQESLEYYDKAINLNAKLANAYYGKALAYGAIKDVENFNICINKNIELNPIVIDWVEPVEFSEEFKSNEAVNKILLEYNYYK